MTARKPWFRVADSLGQDGTSNDVLATFLRFSAFIHTRWARSGVSFKEAAEGELTEAQAQHITGRRSARASLALLDHFAKRFDCAVQTQGRRIFFSWPKWAEFQHPETQQRPRRGRKPAPPEKEKEKEKKQEQEARADGPPSEDSEPPEPDRKKAPWEALLNFVPAAERDACRPWLSRVHHRLESDARDLAAAGRFKTPGKAMAHIFHQRWRAAKANGWEESDRRRAENESRERFLARVEDEHVDLDAVARDMGR